MKVLISTLILLAFANGGRADDLPWTMLRPANDARDAEMREWDEADSRHLVDLINKTEDIVRRSIVWRTARITDLLGMLTPFAELRFDAVKPMSFSLEEKRVLAEWLRRGGFILVFEDTYPYREAEFRHGRPMPAYDFFIRELPSTDSRFQVQRIDDTHPFFHALHATTTTPSITREMAQNPHYRGRRLLTFDGRNAAFFMGRYSTEENGVFVPKTRPFSRDFSSDQRSYYLMLNIYIFTCVM